MLNDHICREGRAIVGIHLAYELTTERVDDTGHRRSFALADEVEVEHSLNGAGL